MTAKRRERPSTVNDIIPTSLLHNVEHRSISAVQYDQVGHFPEHSDMRTRCKFPKCTGKSR